MVTKEMVLDRMASLLEEKGWIQGHSRTEHGFCLVGALGQSVEEQPLTMNEKVKLHEEVRGQLRAAIPYGMGLVCFNDQRGRQKSEVISLIQTARGK